MRDRALPARVAARADALRLDRRTLLRGLGLTGAGLLVAACGGNGDEPRAGGAPGAPVDGDEAVNAALEAAGVEGPPVLTVLVASFETLSGEPQRIQFALLDEEAAPLLDADVQAYLVSAESQEVAVGPASPTFHGEELGDRGVYVFEDTITTPGIYDLVIVTADGRAGTGALRVVRPEESAVLRVGEAFPAVGTPTTEDPQGLAELCTRDPDCGMHATSLAAALEQGSPVVLTIATPKYCSSRICGPVVDAVLSSKERAARDDVVFIHAEVFSDAGATPTAIVDELALPTEPWTFVIGADGAVVDRFDGPVVPALLTPVIESL